MNDNLCLAPWFSLYIGDMTVKQCCLWRSSEYNKWETIEDIENIWHGPKMQKVREDFLKGIAAKECSNCMKRIISRKEWLDFRIAKYIKKERLVVNPPLKPLQVDFQLGSKCNLQCRMCGSWGSSNWTVDDKELLEINPDFDRYSIPEYKLDVSKFKDHKEIFSDVVRFDFKGGEPMIQNDMIEMIENLVRWEKDRNIILAYVTNGSFINKEIISLWNSFKEVRVIISIDGINELFSYIRGYDFGRMENNLYIYDQIENLNGLYNITISNYNILDLAEINHWITERNLKRFPCSVTDEYTDFNCNVTNPPYLDARILPKKYKQMALDRIYKYDYPNVPRMANWLESIKDIPANEKQLRLFVSFTKEMDRRKGTDFLSIKPEFEDLFKEYS